MGYGPLPGAPDSSVVLVEGPWTHRTVRANGIALHVAELGTGPLVLLVHGFPQFWWGWHRQLVDLADAGYRAVAVDLRGYGASDKPPRGYDSATLAADMAALVTSLGETDAMVVGNDIGGTFVWTMAATHPRVVRSAVVLGAAHPLRMRAALRPGAGPEQRHASAYSLRTFQVPRRPEHLLSRDSHWVRELYERWTGPRWRGTPGYVADVERFAQAMRIHPVSFCAAEHFRWSLRSVLRSDGRRWAEAMRTPITAPVLHLHGDFDTCVLPATAQGSGQYVSGEYEWRVLDGVGHFPHSEVPEQVSGELVRWAKTH
ncbi:Pimeloyl-ACP methyl ester carboxylesterase [Jatrophihabitans endophyticus]|uniref:Pimeloyl-ACP methyl ester carboxylesterase n=1 Tax=Jatrophihabitans endophyticus TaxID=1206085 RepID=A0A1M5H2J2_9ACTN|nr:alpha/beta hydrolase [Jatrophihabitans endophyticus]SHG10281.1 Pimeloyl-ACP methyl ester carboxylesterase [Jatrophihabitans endophyticus]